MGDLLRTSLLTTQQRRLSDVTDRLQSPDARRPSSDEPDFFWVAANGVGRGWTRATVVSYAEESGYIRRVILRLAEGGQRDMDINSSDLVPANRAALDRVENISQLDHINEPSVAHVVAERLSSGNNPFTWAGNRVLLFVNPYKNMPQLYSDATLTRHLTANKPEDAAHIWSVGSRVARALVEEKRSQSVVMCGVSGSGKSETLRSLFRFFCARDTPSGTLASRRLQKIHLMTNGGSVSSLLAASDRVIEAFCNAKTTQADNSTRCIRHTTLLFAKGEEHRAPIGAEINVVPMDLMRITNAPTGERVFHIMYQLLATTNNKARQGMSSRPSDYFFLERTGSYDAVSIVDSEERTNTDAALKTLGFSDEEVQVVWDLVASVLLLGNVRFEGDKTATPTPESGVALDRIACLLGIERRVLVNILVTRPSSQEQQQQQNDSSQAEQARNLMAILLYERLFVWLLARIKNVFHDLVSNKQISPLRVMVFDAAGFETFDSVHGNGFAQLMVNYTSERVQALYCLHMFQREQLVYTSENIPWPVATETIPDNTKVIVQMDGCGMSANAEPSLFSVIEQETKNMSATDELLLRQICRSGSIRQKTADSFSIVHHTGSVAYTSAGLLLSNRCYRLPWQLEALGTTKRTQVSIIVKFLSAEEKIAQSTGGGGQLSTSPRGNRRAMLSAPPSSPSNNTVRRPRSGSLAPASSIITSPRSGSELTSTSSVLGAGLRPYNTIRTYTMRLNNILAQLQDNASIHFVRCLRPSKQVRPGTVDGQHVVDQLRYVGACALGRLASVGWPVRIHKSQFYERYGTNAQRWLETQQEESAWRQGTTRFFLSPKAHAALEAMLSKRQTEAAKKIVHVLRVVVLRRRRALISSAVKACLARRFFVQKREERQKTVDNARVAVPPLPLDPADQITSSTKTDSSDQVIVMLRRLEKQVIATRVAGGAIGDSTSPPGGSVCRQCADVQARAEAESRRAQARFVTQENLLRGQLDTATRDLSENEELLQQINDENTRLREEISKLHEVARTYRESVQTMSSEVLRCTQVMERVYAVENLILSKMGDEFEHIVDTVLDHDDAYKMYEIDVDQNSTMAAPGQEGRSVSRTSVAREWYPSAGVLISRFLFFLNDEDVREMVDSVHDRLCVARTVSSGNNTLRRRCYVIETCLMLNVVLRQEVAAAPDGRGPFYSSLCETSNTAISNALNDFCRWLADQCAEDAQTTFTLNYSPDSGATDPDLKVDYTLQKKLAKHYEDMIALRMPTWIVAQVFMHLAYLIDAGYFNSCMRTAVATYTQWSGFWLAMNVRPLQRWLVQTPLAPLRDHLEKLDESRLFFLCADLGRLWQHGDKQSLASIETRQAVCPNMTPGQIAQALRVYKVCRHQNEQPIDPTLLSQIINAEDDDDGAQGGTCVVPSSPREETLSQGRRAGIGNMQLMHFALQHGFSLRHAYRVDLRIFSAMAAPRSWVDWFDLDIRGRSVDSSTDEASKALSYFTRTDSRRAMKLPQYHAAADQ